ncbi:hypothetical protein J4709_09750 [Actinomadura sp. LCR2-06]|uniref:Uncharacterized protein n=1 Tax=Actinomadura violacea TaxID=2819934 RepID=A0ABS3RM69_9ACTN|nr:hypothetical protein [Actinomadura violacea]MBO2457852.1 hypothetical protein [Actinomadura violacea]
MDGIGTRLSTTVHGITDNRSRESPAISDYWSGIYGSCNSRTLLGGLAELCREIATACDHFAGVIDHAHSEVERKLAEAGIAVGLTSLVAGLLTPVTGGGSDVAGAALDSAEAAAILGPVEAETLAATAEGAVSADLVATVEGTVARG